jgi:hypothetical protein
MSKRLVQGQDWRHLRLLYPVKQKANFLPNCLKHILDYSNRSHPKLQSEHGVWHSRGMGNWRVYRVLLQDRRHLLKPSCQHSSKTWIRYKAVWHPFIDVRPTLWSLHKEIQVARQMHWCSHREGVERSYEVLHSEPQHRFALGDRLRPNLLVRGREEEAEKEETRRHQNSDQRGHSDSALADDTRSWRNLDEDLHVPRGQHGRVWLDLQHRIL